MARAAVVDHPRDQPPANAAFTGNQDGDVGRRRRRDLLSDATHRGTVSDKDEWTIHIR
jgi:hypothetical protein